jgi:hypothetical protein
MWSMKGAVGQPKMHRAQSSDCEAIGRQREEMHLAGRRVGKAEPVRRHEFTS